MVAALPDGRIVVGNRAKARRELDPRNVIYSAKRLIGRRFSSPEVERMRRTVPYRILEGDNEQILVELGGRMVTVVEIASMVLGYLREMAEEALGQKARRCVIAVPANFTDAQRSATRIAARLAGLDVIRVINEPTAAALAYGYIEDTDRRIAVYDFGGGTFDVTILSITRNVFEVLATSGEMFLGGDDIDEAITEMLAQVFAQRFGIHPSGDPVAMERLRAAAEQLKIQLSDSERATVAIDEVLQGQPSEFRLEMTASDLRRYVEPVVRRTIPVCEDALQAAGIGPGQVDEIVLVGGTTRLPMVREVVEHVFGKPAQTSINPLSVVAVGAAIQGAALLGSLVPMADGTVQMPGAATAVLLDVVPRSLGVRTVGGYVDMIIERNSAIPIEQTRLFTTSTDNQRFVRIQVCQGESETFDKNEKLGEVVLSGLREAKRGEVTIEVAFEINTDGLLEVRALDRDTGQQQVATMRVLGGMTDAQIDRLATRDSSDRGAVTPRDSWRPT